MYASRRGRHRRRSRRGPRRAARAAAASSSAAASTASSAAASSSSGPSPLVRPGLIGSDPVPLAATAPVAERREVRLVGGDPGLDRLPRASGREAEHRRWNTISSGKSAIGSTTPSRARRTSVGVDAGERRRDAGDLVLHLFDGLEVEVDVEARRQLLRRCASRPSSVPSGVIRRATRCTRPSRLVVLPAFSPHTEVRAGTRRRAPRRRCVNAPTATTNGTASSPARMRMRSGKSSFGLGAEQDQRADAARRPRRRGCRRRRAPARAGTAPHASVKWSRPASSVTRPGRKPGVRPRSSAPRTLPRRSAERNLTFGQRGERGGGLHDRRRPTRPATAATDDHHEVAVATVERR